MSISQISPRSSCDPGLLEIRLRKLEQSNRRLRQGLTIMATLAGLLVFLGQTFPDVEPKPEPEKSSADVHALIAAREIRLVDEQGRVRMSSALVAGSPVLQFFDEHSIPRISVKANSDWPVVEFADEKGSKRVSLGSSITGPGLMLNSPDARPRLVISGADDGPGLLLFDEQRARILVGVKNNQPVMAIMNDESSLNFSAASATPEQESPPLLPKLENP